MNDKFPVVPTDPDAEIEWFDTKEQAELYAAATGGTATTDPHMWAVTCDLPALGTKSAKKPNLQPQDISRDCLTPNPSHDLLATDRTA